MEQGEISIPWKIGNPNHEHFKKIELGFICSGGGIGRHARLKILFPFVEWGFDSLSEYFKKYAPVAQLDRATAF